jgi:RNA polymerase sigma-70 factor (ECF subfamily)
LEQKEIARLFDEYADDVYRLALSYLHNRQDAEDVCQTVFLRLIRYKKQLDAGKEKTWLLTCAANACKDHLKSFWRKHVVALDDTMTFRDEGERALWDAVDSLAPMYRAAVHLYYYEGYTQDEIAAILGISRTAVQTRMSRARAQLKEVLKEYD